MGMVQRLVKKVVIFLLICLMLPSMVVYANAPPPPDYILLELSNLPENAVYADMLIQINPNRAEYVEFNPANGDKYGIDADSPIAVYNENGFMSFTFRYRRSVSDMSLELDSHGFAYARFANEKSVGSSNNEQFANIISNYNIIKVVLLDEHGNILSVSSEVNINPQRFNYFGGLVRYNAANNHIRADVYTSYWGIFIAIFIGISAMLRIAVSVAIETVLAIPFKIKPKWKIVCVNIGTQMLLILFMIFSNVPYLQALLISEAFVYISEYGIYTQLFKEIPKRKLALYTVAANTASLVIGVLLNAYRFFERFF
jgi:fluoride ion exporter CrcB/FEX